MRVAKQLLSFQIHVKPNALDKNLRSVQVALGGEYSTLGELVHSTEEDPLVDGELSSAQLGIYVAGVLGNATVVARDLRKDPKGPTDYRPNYS